MLEDALSQVREAIDNWWSAPIRKGQPGEGGSMRDRVLQWTPVAVEEKITLDLPSGHTLVGLADVVYADDQGACVVVDHKSATNFRRYPLDGSGLGPQATTYTELVKARHGWTADRFEYHIARVLPATSSRFERIRVVTLNPTDADRAALQETLQAAGAMLDERRFPKAPDWFLCSAEWCPFHVDAGGPCDPYAQPEWDLRKFAA